MDKTGKKFIPKEKAPKDLIDLYNNLAGTYSNTLKIGSSEWVNLMKQHLNKAYGIAATGIIGTEADDW